MFKLRLILSAAIALLFLPAVHAQDKTAPAPSSGGGQAAGTGTRQARIGIGAVGGVIGGLAGPGLGSVSGRPFSADVVEETDQSLSDGTHIHREMHGKIFRDSEGRTRNEHELGLLGGLSKHRMMIHIFDPVENTMIVLDPDEKIAHVNHFKALPKESRPVQRPAPAPPAGGSTTARPGTLHPVQSTHEDLGTSDFEGFIARGTRYFVTVPEGAVGNDRPMTTTRESWYSDDLQTELLSKSESPQSGARVRRLVNLHGGDPDPLLFQVPADYTVKEQPQR